MKISTSLLRFLFLLSAALCLLPQCSPPWALLLGFVLWGAHASVPWDLTRLSTATKKLLQFCVVGLGFGMNLDQLRASSVQGFHFTIGSLVGTFLLGTLLCRLLRVDRRLGYLITCGTAICGGSAIAAVAPVLGASAAEMSVALGTVFSLNALALVVFPWVGKYLQMSPQDFGFWSALAIHDTSSVVGAAAMFGMESLKIATAVKLARALWIIPVTLLTSFVRTTHWRGAKVPVFIVLFVGAVCLRSWFPQGQAVFDVFVVGARLGLKVTLFLIGASLSVATLRKLGGRAFLLGLLLWLSVSSGVLWMLLSSSRAEF